MITYNVIFWEYQRDRVKDIDSTLFIVLKQSNLVAVNVLYGIVVCTGADAIMTYSVVESLNVIFALFYGHAGVYLAPVHNYAIAIPFIK